MKRITALGARVRASCSAAPRRQTANTESPALVMYPGPVSAASQRSLHTEPIFRLLLKVAVNGAHQCDFYNFCGASAPTIMSEAAVAPMQLRESRCLGRGR